MSMWASTEVYDGLLNIIRDNVSSSQGRLAVCTTQPTTYADASSSFTNYARAVTSALTTASVTIADSSASGRKITIAQQSNITVSTSGDAAHVAITNATSSKLVYVTTCNTKSLTTADTVTIPAWSIHVLSPTSTT